MEVVREMINKIAIFFFQAEDGIRDGHVTGVQTCALPISYAAFLAHAAQDWDWELPAVTTAGLACGAAAIAGPAGPRLPRLAAVLPAALCVLAAVAFAGNNA